MPYLVTADGTPLHFLDEGLHGDAGLLLIHAEPFNCRFWRHNIPALKRAFRVVAVDVRGRGESGKTDFGHNIRQYADDLRFMIEALGLERVVVVGWSLGGSIAWSYMEQFGHARLGGYVNVDQEPYRFVSEEHLEKRLNSIRTRRLAHHTDAVVQYFGPTAERDQETVNWMVYECMKTPTSAHIAAVTDSYHSDFRPHMSRVTVPSQIYWSRYGNIKPELAEFMHASTPGSELVYFETCGHLIPWVEAEKFNRELTRFTEKVLG
ncbi:MAG: alpha/beta hydrolase [Proteobacteria bacterium]|nr:alpha/beta hydrolase [Pseudomonadota bacterium]